MYIKYTLHFKIHPRAGEAGKDKAHPLRMRLVLKGQHRLDINTGISLYTYQYDNTREKVTGTDKKSKEAKRVIQQWRDIIEDLINRYEIIEKRMPDITELRDIFLDTIGRASIEEKVSLSIDEAFTEYVSEIQSRNGVSDATAVHLRTARNRLINAIGNIDITRVNENHMDKMQANLVGKGLKNTTIQKNEQMVRGFLHWCQRKGYNSVDWLDNYKPRYKVSSGEKEIIYLTTDELHQLEQADLVQLVKEDRENNNPKEPFAPGQLDRCRDVFLFCCYTSLRYSDVYALKRIDVNKHSIHIVTQKTADSITIDLNTRAREILNKYAHEDMPDDKALPVVCSQLMNRMLKYMFRIAKFNRPIKRVYYVGSKRQEEILPLHQVISSHCGRRTFVVLALTLGIPAEVIMRWTGHSSYNAMKPYIAIVDELKREQMKKFDTL